MAEPEVLVSFHADGGVGRVTLNREAKLNALNLNMIRLLHVAVDQIDQRSGKLSCIVMDGAGGKAFCAGGDVAQLRTEALAGGSLPADFFFEEYALVFRLAEMFERTGCCQVSLWDGITMGGGVGLSAHAPFRVVTEKTVFAKPEGSIGLFPDVGSTHLLSHLQAGASVGMFVGLTGAKLTAADCLRAGLATHFVPSADIPRLREALARHCIAGATGSAGLTACEAAIREVAAGALPPAAGALLTEEHVEVIERCFGAPTLEDIVGRLQAEVLTSKFAAETLKTLAACSPTSCKVTLRALRDAAGAGVSLARSLQVEYRLSQRFTTRPQPLSDFHEGIRGVLVDKDRNHKWSPGWDDLGSVTDERVAAFFAPLEPGHRRGELALERSEAWGEAERPPFPAVTFMAKL